MTFQPLKHIILFLYYQRYCYSCDGQMNKKHGTHNKHQVSCFKIYNKIYPTNNNLCKNLVPLLFIIYNFLKFLIHLENIGDVQTSILF